MTFASFSGKHKPLLYLLLSSAFSPILTEPEGLQQSEETCVQHQQGLRLRLPASPRGVLLHDRVRHAAHAHPGVAELALCHRRLGDRVPARQRDLH